MLNLHSYFPEMFEEDNYLMINLEAFYKQHSQTSHEFALEKIFAEGMKYAMESDGYVMNDFIALQKAHSELRTRYENLLAMHSDKPVISDSAAQRQAVEQTLGMGKTLK